jgi:hypothetical protein
MSSFVCDAGILLKSAPSDTHNFVCSQTPLKYGPMGPMSKCYFSSLGFYFFHIGPKDAYITKCSKHHPLLQQEISTKM